MQSLDPRLEVRKRTVVSAAYQVIMGVPVLLYNKKCSRLGYSLFVYTRVESLMLMVNDDSYLRYTV
jgi:hypothetical protein